MGPYLRNPEVTHRLMVERTCVVTNLLPLTTERNHVVSVSQVFVQHFANRGAARRVPHLVRIEVELVVTRWNRT